MKLYKLVYFYEGQSFIKFSESSAMLKLLITEMQIVSETKIKWKLYNPGGIIIAGTEEY